MWVKGRHVLAHFGVVDLGAVVVNHAAVGKLVNEGRANAVAQPCGRDHFELGPVLLAARGEPAFSLVAGGFATAHIKYRG